MAEAERLELTCPPQGAKWNLHPRVYLTAPPGATEAACPYCGAKYPIPGRREEKPAAEEAGA
ncbi:MAG: zinc-finger domain-containing protein [Betaproteobacteria bacterium AqS2]|uniref:Zinc-finger domain-containing protein n=1 Tax=Candidatus Amphirhobacter heronislandensis TaxID=1732024 RepID=A0A930UG35_9GAMM|nr:zinc-finger domain-containing protein [Betaproteobacteria bacterium AqS2]